MADEQPEDGNSKNSEDELRTDEERNFILAVLKEAIISAGIRDIAEYKGEPLTQRWHLFFQEYPTDIILKMVVQGLFGTIHADMSLLLTARWIINEVKSALSQPDANSLFDITDEDHFEVLRENSRMILASLIKRIPTVAFRFLSQSLDEAFRSHIKTHLEPLLKEHWQALGKAENFTISMSKEFESSIQSTNEQFEALRRELLGDKRARLTAERRGNLDNEHEQLRVQYQVARDYFAQAQKAFLDGKRNRTIDQWREEWQSLGARTFPDLLYSCLSEINDYQPFELAHRHLAEFYGYKPQYMMKLVTQASGLRSEKTQ